MRIAMDPAPLVLGIYAHVGGLVHRAGARTEDRDPEELGRRYGAPGESEAERAVQRLVKAVHNEIKTSDKLLKKTGDVWRLAADGGRIDLVVHRRGEAEDPRSYVLLRPEDVRDLLKAIRAASVGAGSGPTALHALDEAIEAIAGRPSDYYTFGFDPASPR